MLEFANTTPANGKIKEETHSKEQGVQAPPAHTQKRALHKVSYFGTVCVGKRLVGREDLLLGSSLGPSSP